MITSPANPLAEHEAAVTIGASGRRSKVLKTTGPKYKTQTATPSAET